METYGIFPSRKQTIKHDQFNKTKYRRYQSNDDNSKDDDYRNIDDRIRIHNDEDIDHDITNDDTNPKQNQTYSSLSSSSSLAINTTRYQQHHQVNTKPSSTHNITHTDNNIGRNTTKSSIVIAAVVENRAREVCLAKYNTNNGSSLDIYLFTDCHSYAETLSLLEELTPDEILLHDGCKRRILSQKIEEDMPEDTRILYISRQYFDQDRGAELLAKILIGSVDADVIAKYTVLASAHCLLRYIENCQNISFTSHCLRLQYCNSYRGRTIIDRHAALNLELISNVMSGNQTESLFGAINRTKTVVGARLLRSNILRPWTVIKTLNGRLDVVELFLKNNAIMTELNSLLTKFPDLDRMLTGLTSIPKQRNAVTARASIDTLISLRKCILLVPTLSDIVAKMLCWQQEHQVHPRSRDARAVSDIDDNEDTNEAKRLLQAMLQVCQREEMLIIQKDVDALLLDTVIYAKSSIEMRHPECFAIRGGLSGALDIARKTFLLCVQDIQELADRYSQEFEIDLKVQYTSSRGYYLSTAVDLAKPLPAVFIRAIQTTKLISCTTLDLCSLSERALNSIQNALMLTHDLVQDALTKSRQQMEGLFALTDSVALLDMLCSFAELVAMTPQCHSRPILIEDGPLVISAGRHPVLSIQNSQHRRQSFVENDTYLDSTHSFQILTGANGSGKTVYLKQVALIIILAQIGCFVPARHATIPIRDRILARLGTADDMEHNMSTFFIEMKECAYILSILTAKSFVIIDELGRGTSNIDGLSIAFAFAEYLAHAHACTIFVTHYSQITALSTVYPCISNIHMKSSLALSHVDRDFSSNSSADSHQLCTGAFETRSGYGITMAERCAFPPSVIAEARSLQRVVTEAFPILLQHEDFDRTLFDALALLQQLLVLQSSTLADVPLAAYLQSIRNQLSPAIISRLMRFLDELDAEDESNSFAPQTCSLRQADDEGNDRNCTVQQSSIVESSNCHTIEHFVEEMDTESTNITKRSRFITEHNAFASSFSSQS